MNNRKKGSRKQNPGAKNIRWEFYLLLVLLVIVCGAAVTVGLMGKLTAELVTVLTGIATILGGLLTAFVNRK